MSKVTSVRISDENLEYCDEMGIKPSAYINEKLDEDRASAGLTRREQLERELAQVREERSRKKRTIDDLEDKASEIEQQLEEYQGTQEREIEDALEGLHWLTRVHPDLRPVKEYTAVVRKKTGLRHSLLVDLCDSVDIHYAELLGSNVEELDNRGVERGELYSHELYDEPAGDELTSDEEEAIRAFLRNERL
jgi:hypothetical protein